MPDDLPADYASALAATAPRRGAFGSRILYFNAIGSTNDEAARLADAGAPEGTTVLAGAQTAGRGRFGRTWFSPPGAGLYVSIVIRNRRAAPLLTLAGGVAVAEGIRSATALPVEIKWPNDIVVDAGLGRRRKVAGILAEASTGAAGLQHVVVGFGVNIADAAYPPEITDRATSLEAELGRPVGPAMVFGECLAAMAERVADVAGDGQDRVLRRWSELAPSARGSRVEWDTVSGPRVGVTAGIDQQGALLVRDGATVERVVSGAVRWR